MTAMRIGSVPGTGMTPASGGTFKSAAEWSSETTAPVPLSSAGISTDTAAARTEQAKRSAQRHQAVLFRFANRKLRRVMSF